MGLLCVTHVQILAVGKVAVLPILSSPIRLGIKGRFRVTGKFMQPGIHPWEVKWKRSIYERWHRLPSMLSVAMEAISP
jgi:hypothetical protein